MTPEQINEAMSLAYLLATARVIRVRVKDGATFMSEKAAMKRVIDADNRLRNYLTQFQTVSDAHTTEGEK